MSSEEELNIPENNDSEDSFKSALEAEIDKEEVTNVGNLTEAELLHENEDSSNDHPIDEYSDLPNEDLFELMKEKDKESTENDTSLESSKESSGETGFEKNQASPEEVVLNSPEDSGNDEIETDPEDNPLLIDETVDKEADDENPVTIDVDQDDSDSEDPLDIPNDINETKQDKAQLIKKFRMAFQSEKKSPVKDNVKGEEFQVGKTIIKKISLSNLPKKELNEISNPDLISYIRKNCSVGSKGEMKTILVKKKSGGFEIVKFPAGFNSTESSQKSTAAGNVIPGVKDSYTIKKISPVPGLVKKSINLRNTSTPKQNIEVSKFNPSQKYRLVRKQDDLFKPNEVEKRPDYQLLPEAAKPAANVELFPKAIFYPKPVPTVTSASQSQCQLQIGSVTSLASTEKFTEGLNTTNKPKFIELSLENFKKRMIQSDISFNTVEKPKETSAKPKFLVKSVGKLVSNPEKSKILPYKTMSTPSTSKTVRVMNRPSTEDLHKPGPSKKIIIHPPHYYEKNPTTSNVIYKAPIKLIQAAPQPQPKLEIKEVHGNYHGEDLEPPKSIPKKITYMIPQNLFAKSVGPPKTEPSTESRPVIEAQAKAPEPSTKEDDIPQPKRRRKDILVPKTSEIEFEDPYIPPPRPEINVQLSDNLAYYRTVAKILMQHCLKVNYGFDFNENSKNYIKTYNYNRDKPVFHKQS